MFPWCLCRRRRQSRPDSTSRQSPRMGSGGGGRLQTKRAGGSWPPLGGPGDLLHLQWQDSSGFAVEPSLEGPLETAPHLTNLWLPFCHHCPTLSLCAQNSYSSAPASLNQQMCVETLDCLQTGLGAEDPAVRQLRSEVGEDRGLPWWLSNKESICQCRRRGFSSWVGKIPWRRAWHPTPVFSSRTEEPDGLQTVGSQRVRHN